MENSLTNSHKQRVRQSLDLRSSLLVSTSLSSSNQQCSLTPSSSSISANHSSLVLNRFSPPLMHHSTTVPSSQKLIHHHSTSQRSTITNPSSSLRDFVPPSTISHKSLFSNSHQIHNSITTSTIATTENEINFKNSDTGKATSLSHKNSITYRTNQSTGSSTSQSTSQYSTLSGPRHSLQTSHHRTILVDSMSMMMTNNYLNNSSKIASTASSVQQIARPSNQFMMPSTSYKSTGRSTCQAINRVSNSRLSGMCRELMYTCAICA